MTRLGGLLITLGACHSTYVETTLVVEPRGVAPPVAGEVGSPPRVPLERLAPRAGASIALARTADATLAYVADADAGVLRVIDVDRQRELAAIALDGKPAELVLLDDHRLAVTLRDRDELAVLAGSGLADAPLAITQRIALPVEPIGLALRPDDRALVVTSGWGHALTLIAVPRDRPLATVDTWDIAPEPRTVVVSDDGRFAFVSHAIGQNVERIDLTTRARERIGVSGVEEMIEMGDPRSHFEARKACQGFALVKSIAPEGRIFAPQVLVNTGVPGAASEGYGADDARELEAFDVAVIDEDRGAAFRESLIHRIRQTYQRPRCALPRAAATSLRGTLFVSCLGDNTILELEGASVAPVNAEVARWTVAAGPTGIAIDDANQRMIVWSQHAQTLTALPLGDRKHDVTRTLVLGHDALPPQLARGRELFVAVNDKRISRTGQACASCHPDGRQDALVWSSPDGPRQTPMLAGRLADTAPYGWNGSASTVAKHMKQTFARLGGKGLAGADLDALIAYVTAMPAPDPVGSPPANLIADGEALFRSDHAQCASCHGDDGRTPDGMRHDVRSFAFGDKTSKLDTPTLAAIAGTAPYYHDGRFATLRELLERTHGKMGQTRRLAPHELDALEAYLRTR